MAHCLQLSGKPAAAVEHMNAVIAQQPWFLAALAEKAKLLVAMHEWEQALEVVNYLLQQEPDNVQALHLSGHSVKPSSHLQCVGAASARLHCCSSLSGCCCTQESCPQSDLHQHVHVHSLPQA